MGVSGSVVGGGHGGGGGGDPSGRRSKNNSTATTSNNLQSVKQVKADAFKSYISQANQIHSKVVID